MNSQEMMKTNCPKGFMFSNVANVDEPQNWVLTEKPKGWDECGNPNHPIYNNKIFGYDESEFLSRQYK